MLGLKLTHVDKRGPWWCQVIAWTKCWLDLIGINPREFHRKCASYADKNFSFEIHILDSFMNLPCDNELITVPAFRSGLSELTHIP